MMIRNSIVVLFCFLLIGCTSTQKSWKIEAQKEWQSAIVESSNIKIKDGQLISEVDATNVTVYKKFSKKHKLQSITIKQSPNWDSWQKIDPASPEMADDAPVFIPVSKGNYWFLGRYKGDTINGYHSWHSTDMKSWKHYGPITSRVNRWVTSAEYVSGKFYIYFDNPNDEYPHLIIDEDLTDGKQGKEIGMVLNDPSHGSDMAIMRDDDGIFHLIYEDWSPLDASKHAWDSPLAGHADSPDGINDFEPHEFPAPIDKRTTPTGKIVPYKPHPNQFLPGKDLSPYNYEIHEGQQDAFGDYTLIKVGGQYYIFCDYDPHEKGKSMRVGRWRSDDITKEFIWDGEIGEKLHPDPTIGFAEGKFYLFVQKKKYDFISDGPWVDGVEVRAGVDTDNDGDIDRWTEFTKIKETYSQKKGFVRVVESQPARFNISELDAGYGFKIELRIQSNNGVSPIIDVLNARFE